MEKYKSILGVVSILLILGLSGLAEARVGGGRSSGYRGSRGFAPRSAPARPYNTQPQNAQPMNTRPNYSGGYGAPMSNPGGGFVRGLMGGIAGGFLGSMIARNLGYGGGMGMPGGSGGGGIGIFEILLLAGLGFFLFRKFAQSQAMNTSPAPMYGNGSSAQSSYSSASSMASNDGVREVASEAMNEQDLAEAIRRSDPGFDLTRFKEDRMDDFLKIQSSWNTRDLTAVQGLIASEMREILDANIRELKQARQINKLENIAVRASDLVESWQESGKEYATLHFRAQLLDYTIDEGTQSLVSGDRTQPVKFDEEWTFVRNTSVASSSMNPWKLTAISNS